MKLKTYLRQSLIKTLRDLKERVSDAEKAQISFADFDLKNADYEVIIYSLWQDHGEKNVAVEHKGTLEFAIKKAEREFLELNKRNAQGEYFVEVKVGKIGLIVPEEYFREYKGK